jgi:thiaminase (transcriptional activator TenA)
MGGALAIKGRAMTDSFTGELWQGVIGIYEAILAHPFLTGLVDGTLPDEAFAFYVIQDSLYLEQYGHTLAAIASRAPGADETEMFARHFVGVVAVEQQLHDTLLSELGIDPDAAKKTEMAPTTLAYTSYLLATARGGSYTEGVCTVLPCYWIYWEVGKELRRRGSADPRFQRWIDTYGGEDFGRYVQEVLDVTNQLAIGLSDDERAQMHWHFRTTSRYEWMFWDMGFRQERWPIPA